MYKILAIIALSFFIFILWIIYLANTGGSSVFFELVGSMPYGDKLGHFGLFGLLTYLFNFASKFKTLQLIKFDIYYGTLAVLIFALVEEVSQHFFATRSLDWLDILADLVGISVFSYFSWLTSSFLYSHSVRSSIKRKVLEG
ncbi:MAG: VanZ family protein [Kangiellaceae bacterium]|nr:VanZ family protein [Kangiellaceae bacterium]